MEIKVVVNGARGKMGQEVVKAVSADEEMQLVGELDIDDDLRGVLEKVKPDVMVDFTHPSAARENVLTAIESGVNAVVGTTGLQDEELKEIDALAKRRNLGILVAPNFCIGAVLMMKFAREAAKFMPEVEIIELHHPGKADAPSGTARLTAEGICKVREKGIKYPNLDAEMMAFRGGRVGDVSVHSVRLPGLVAHQEVIFGGEGQTLTIRHDSLNRESFMFGVLLAIRAVSDLTGLVYGLDRILFGEGCAVGTDI